MLLVDHVCHGYQTLKLRRSFEEVVVNTVKERKSRILD
jgi:hypothetical protein